MLARAGESCSWLKAGCGISQRENVRGWLGLGGLAYVAARPV